MSADPVVVRLVVGPLAANCYLLACPTRRAAIVIDPGDDAEVILSRIRQEGWTTVAIVDTHGHFDHVGANGAVVRATGAPLLIHGDDAPLLPEAAVQAASFGLQVPPSPPPTRHLTDGDSIEVGDLVVTVIHTPGHSPGGICLSCPPLLFTGDTLFAGSVGRTDLPGGDHRTLISSITKRLLPLADDTLVLPGHGPTSTMGEERTENPFIRPHVP